MFIGVVVNTFRNICNLLKYIYYIIISHYGTAIALMGVTFFHLNDVKAADEKVLPKAELKEDLLPANVKIKFSVSKRTKEGGIIRNETN
jgi:hypothetical protein